MSDEPTLTTRQVRTRILSAESVLSSMTSHGILGENELRGVRTDARSASELIEQLVASGKLTAFQAERLLADEASSLVLGNYLLTDELGSGGMGQVFKALHRRMDRVVAVKLLSPQLVADEAAVQRFFRESRAAARLGHPNIVTAYDSGEDDGRHYLVMEFVDGRDLRTLVRRRGPASVDRAINCIVQAARGLGYAHGRGIVHRDVKPGNLLLDAEGTVKVLDMGLARFETSASVPTEAELTGTGTMMGTVDYMSPEQASDTRSADARSDVYSLGCTLHFLLTGEPVYEGESIVERLLAHRERPVPSLTKRRADVPQRVDAVFRRMIAKRPDDRFATMDEVVTALEQHAGQSAPMPDIEVPDPDSARAETVTTAAASRTSVGPSRPKRPPTRSRVRTRLLLGAAGVTVALLFVLARTFGPWTSSETTASGDNSNVTPGVSETEGGSSPPNATPVRPVAVPAKPEVENLALYFDGVDDYAQLPFGYDGKHPITIEAWVTPLEPPNRHHTILSNSDGSGAKLDIVRTGYRDVPEKFTFTVYSRENEEKIRVPSDDSVVPGRRVHIAGVFQQDQARLFINGKLQRKARYVEDYVPSALNFLIGGNPTFYKDIPRPKPDYGLCGILDEIRFSAMDRYGVTDFEPKTRFEPDKTTIALYHCDDRNPGQLTEATRFGKHGQLFGARYVTEAEALALVERYAAWPPKQREMLEDDPVSLEFRGGAAASVQVPFDPTKPFTAEAWVQPFFDVEAFGTMGLFSLSPAYRVGLRRSPFGVGWKFELLGTSFNKKSYVDTVYPVRSGHISHFAAVYDGEFLRVFDDARIVGWRRVGTPSDITFDGLLRIGTDGVNPSFNGRVLSFRLSQTALYTDAGFNPPRRFEPGKDTLVLYHMDEGRGTELEDASGHRRNAALFGTAWGDSRKSTNGDK